ncbi:hypothetical protein [Minwuia thermotolerans]|uniref:hypothetical protein n=1 Tax=Minwuia thermotolerans TaxID=2056226 RepID=UPI000F63750A|nr:hypothetical protein [Minwuia thermotolerans]
MDFGRDREGTGSGFPGTPGWPAASVPRRKCSAAAGETADKAGPSARIASRICAPGAKFDGIALNRYKKLLETILKTEKNKMQNTNKKIYRCGNLIYNVHVF